MYIHFCVCMRVRACERERGRDKEQWTDTGVKYYFAQCIQAAIFSLASPPRLRHSHLHHTQVCNKLC